MSKIKEWPRSTVFTSLHVLIYLLVYTKFKVKISKIWSLCKTHQGQPKSSFQKSWYSLKAEPSIIPCHYLGSVHFISLPRYFTYILSQRVYFCFYQTIRSLTKTFADWNWNSKYRVSHVDTHLFQKEDHTGPRSLTWVACEARIFKLYWCLHQKW